MLSASLKALSLKADYGLSKGCFNEWVKFMSDALPNGNCMPKNLYHAKKTVAELGLACVKIDCCPGGCMLYYKEDEMLQSCKFCPEKRYKEVRKQGKEKLVPQQKMWYFPLVPRLQRLYSSMQTASHMRWHHEHYKEPDFLSHPSDAEAWMKFDEAWGTFADEPRNVRLGLCSDGFAPFDISGKKYSCWPVIVTPYNLPPWMCMRREFMFLTIMIPGPSAPKKSIDVYLRPLIDELKMLWEDGVMTYDVSLKQNFLMKAAVMWTINDFPAYGMLSGWMTMGKLACPVCMERSKAFSLAYSRKVSWFDCHRQFLSEDHEYRKCPKKFTKGKGETSTKPRRLNGEEVWERIKHLPSKEESKEGPSQGYGVKHQWTSRSIFWELPYWKTLLLPHNIDVMHTERNVFLNILFTVMDTKGKTKDTFKFRKDLEEYCLRGGLEVQQSENGNFFKPKAQYALTKQQRLAVCEWVKNLKLPDGYVSNLGRCVDLSEAKLSGMKSHDCHVFMQRLLPIAFKALPKPIWNTLTEFSQFWRELTSSLLMESKLRIMEENIPIILCKLEQIFPPSFFDSMEHLPIHLPYEARVGGPVHYRWMYPFERFIRTLKQKVTNKAHVEGSICKAYLLEEMSTFASYYYPPDVPSRRTRVPRNDGECSSQNPPLSIFNHAGRGYGKCITTTLDGMEVKSAHFMYSDLLRELDPVINDADLDKQISMKFPTWFKTYVLDSRNQITDVLLTSLAWGPLRNVNKWHSYVINGYKFITKAQNEGMCTTNFGVCVRGGQSDIVDYDYYGMLIDIVELEYTGSPTKKLVLFKCDWFDSSPQGTRIDSYGNVEIIKSRRYSSYDPFILAQQAEQVYFSSYPEGQQGWLAVIKTKARNTILSSGNKKPDDVYQDDDVETIPAIIANDDLEESLVDISGVGEELPPNQMELEDQEEEDEDIEYSSSSEEDGELIEEDGDLN
ncbi:uncharacterized protein LOC130728921 [Lotus japonicus]|uniref:uncharacterized protein LOC130728921 n=1 Tax=Lotus japonicus TaxID=34305 RepID=UPI0025835320|nr:uncharacterized protein LOC130728921 [Lotus japonicus]